MVRTKHTEESELEGTVESSHNPHFVLVQPQRAQRSAKEIITKAVIVLAIGGGIAYGAYEYVSGGIAEKRLAQELAAAKAEGIITTPAEIAALERPVPASLNAGPIYQAMYKRMPKGARIDLLVWDAGNLGSQEGIKAGRKFLSDHGRFVSLAEEASTKPFSKTERDYSLGGALITPELAALDRGAAAIRLKAVIAHRDGKNQEALKSLRQAQVLTSHLRNDLQSYADNRSRQLLEYDLHLLASWAWSQPENQTWLKELRRLASACKVSTERELSRLTLANTLSTMDAVQKHGRKGLGFKEPTPFSLDAIAKLNPLIQGRIRLIKGFRKAWKVMDKADPKLEKERADAEFLFTWGLLSDPTTMTIMDGVGGKGKLDTRDIIARQKVRRALFQAVVEALSQPKGKQGEVTSTSILSPITGQAIRVKWTGTGFEVIDSLAVVPSAEQMVQIPPSKVSWKNSYRWVR